MPQANTHTGTANWKQPHDGSDAPAAAAGASARPTPPTPAAAPAQLIHADHSSSKPATFDALHLSRSDAESDAAAGLRARSQLTGEQAIAAARLQKGSAQVRPESPSVIPQLDSESPLSPSLVPCAASSSPSPSAAASDADHSRHASGETALSESAAGSCSGTWSMGSSMTITQQEQRMRQHSEQLQQQQQHAHTQGHTQAQVQPIVDASLIPEASSELAPQERVALEQQATENDMDAMSRTSPGLQESPVEAESESDHELGEEEKADFLRIASEMWAAGHPMGPYGPAMAFEATPTLASASAASAVEWLPTPAPLEPCKSDESTASDRDPATRTPTQEDLFLAQWPVYCATGCGSLAEKYCWSCLSPLCPLHKNQQHYNAQIRHQIYGLQYAMRIIRLWLREANIGTECTFSSLINGRGGLCDGSCGGCGDPLA